VDQHTFYHTRESGGTAISSALLLCRDLIRTNYNPAEWNVYLFQFSDGDNWEDDNSRCARLLAQDLLPDVNLFCYGEVQGPRGQSMYTRTLKHLDWDDPERLTLVTIGEKDEIYEAIKAFLGKGR